MISANMVLIDNKRHLLLICIIIRPGDLGVNSKQYTLIFSKEPRLILDMLGGYINIPNSFSKLFLAELLSTTSYIK